MQSTHYNALVLLILLMTVQFISLVTA